MREIAAFPLLHFPEEFQDHPGDSLDALLDELRNLIASLGKDGGSITPSIYDTAQVIRFYLTGESARPGLEWLVSEQNADGGWGSPVVPRMRDVPTVAAILALKRHNPQGAFDAPISQGIRFLHQQRVHWGAFMPDDLPVGVELVLPKLVYEAIKMGVKIPIRQYRKLIALGKGKKEYIRRMPVIVGTPAAFSWEAWGTDKNMDVQDEIGSVGNSPAATVAWISAAKKLGKRDLSRSVSYLENASKATGLDIPGVVPFAWPINRFEQSFGLYALAVAGLLKHPVLQDAVRRQVEDLSKAVYPIGLAFSDHFIPDVDDTSAALTTLHAMDMHADYKLLEGFRNSQGGYFTYPGELHASLSAHARAVHASSLLVPQKSVPGQSLLISMQKPDGRWVGDKWHSSWFYTTSHMLYALKNALHTQEVKSALNVILLAQNPDGGWGLDGHSTTSETAYVLLALEQFGLPERCFQDSLHRGQEWLLKNFTYSCLAEEKLWIGKELYKPRRVDRAFELAAMIRSVFGLLNRPSA